MTKKYPKFQFLIPIGKIIFFSSFFCACSNNATSPVDTITTVISAPIQSLDPLQATDANTQHVNELIHAPLVQIGENLAPEPYLAEKIHYIGEKIIEIELRKNCVFHNGKKITSNEVKKTLELFSSNQTKSHFVEIFSKIKKFEELNEYRFRLHTEKAEPSLLTDLALLKIMPIDSYSSEKFQEMPMGAGPYRIIKNTDGEILLQRYQTQCLPFPKTEKIKIKVVRDDLSKYLKLKNGEVDFILNELNFRKLEVIKNSTNSPLKIVASEGIAYSYLGVNQLNPHLKDLRVRRALALSFDIPSLIRYKSKNMASQARNLLADSNFYANKSVTIVQRDLEKARDLLDEAGYFNGKNHKPVLRLTLKTTTNSTAIENAQVLAAQAKELGIELELRSYEWGIFYNDIKTKNTELYLLRWVGVSDPGQYYEIFHSNEISRNNRTSYSNKTMDKLLEDAQNTLDPKKRKKIYAKVQELAAQDLPYIGLWHTKNVAAFRKNIKNVKLFPNGSWRSFLLLEKENE